MVPTSSIHRLRRGLPGYLILFAPTLSLLSVSDGPETCLRHWCSSRYLHIPPLHEIPVSPTALKPARTGADAVKRWTFTPDATNRLRALYAQ